MQINRHFPSLLCRVDLSRKCSWMMWSSSLVSSLVEIQHVTCCPPSSLRLLTFISASESHSSEMLETESRSAYLTPYSPSEFSSWSWPIPVVSLVGPVFAGPLDNLGDTSVLFLFCHFSGSPALVTGSHDTWLWAPVLFRYSGLGQVALLVRMSLLIHQGCVFDPQ